MNEERWAKHGRIIGWLEGRALDGVVLTRRCNFSWYTGGAHNHVAEAGDVGVSSLVVTREGACVVSNNIEATRLTAEDLPDDIPVVEYPYHDGARRLAAFDEATGRHGDSPVAGGGRFASDAPLELTTFEATDAGFNRLRWQLTGPEIERYRVLCLDVAESVEQAARSVLPGTTEFEAAGLLAASLRAKGCTPWVLLVGADGRIASHRHRAVTTVDAALILATRPGATLGGCFAAAQAAYEQTGFADEWTRHHQGGSIGYLPREVKAAPGSGVPVLADQAFAWNPSVAGTKCEDTLLCRKDGCEIMTHTGRWPTVEAEWAGRVLQRPDILAL